jgi:hypothetical protein
MNPQQEAITKMDLFTPAVIVLLLFLSTFVSSSDLERMTIKQYVRQYKIVAIVAFLRRERKRQMTIGKTTRLSVL